MDKKVKDLHDEACTDVYNTMWAAYTRNILKMVIASGTSMSAAADPGGEVPG